MTTLVADGDEIVADTVTLITFALATDHTFYLPTIGDDDFAAGGAIAIRNTGTGRIRLLSLAGARVGWVLPKSEGYVIARNDGTWTFLVERAASAPAAAIADASTAHALNSTFSDTEAEAALNALGTKINSIIAALEGVDILASS